MTTNASSMEEQLANLTKVIEGLTRHMEHQESHIDKLIDRVDDLLDGKSSHAPGKGIEIQETENTAKQSWTLKELPVSAEGMIPLDQLKEFIEGTIKDKYEISTRSSHMYAKPYTTRIDSLRMPVSYQPPKFQQFKAKEIQSNILHTLWRHVIMLRPIETISSNNSSIP